MKRSTPSLDEAMCIAATTGALVRAVFTFNLERLGSGRAGAAQRILAETEAACGHHADTVSPRDDLAAFVVTADPALIAALCNHPAVTTASVYRPESEVAEARATVRSAPAAA